MADAQEIVHRLKNAAATGRHEDVITLAPEVWPSAGGPLWIALAAYRAAKELQDSALAEIWVDRGLAVAPGDWRLLRAKGDIVGHNGELEQATEYYSRATLAAPDRPAPFAALGRVLFLRRRYVDAAESLRTAVQLAGDDARSTWLAQLGMAEMKNGRLDEALAATKRANKIRPDQNLSWRIAELERRVQIGAAGSLEATAGYYDDVFAMRDEYQLHWLDNAYAGAWKKIFAKLRTRDVRSILDLGCGPGQFAQAVGEQLPGVRYHGVDFSEVAIRRASELAPEFGFTKLTLPVATYDQFEPFDCVICTEVLEHIEKDRAILEPVPKGVFVVFSVPNFDSFGHVRIFTSKDDVLGRYDQFFYELTVEPCEMGSLLLWLAAGVRN